MVSSIFPQVCFWVGRRVLVLVVVHATADFFKRLLVVNSNLAGRRGNSHRRNTFLRKVTTLAVWSPLWPSLIPRTTRPWRRTAATLKLTACTLARVLGGRRRILLLQPEFSKTKRQVNPGTSTKLSSACGSTMSLVLLEQRRYHQSEQMATGAVVLGMASSQFS